MTDILTSIRGRRLGLGENDELVVNGRAVALAPGHTHWKAGSANGATVVAEEMGDGCIHTTLLTLTNTPLSVVSVTTGNGVGGFKLYTFPEGYIHVLGSYAEISLSIATAKQADFTDGTPEGDIGIGSLLPANADALGTDATDDDIMTAAAFTMSSYAAANVKLKADAATLILNGSSTAEDVNLNILVDAADIDDGVTTEILASGVVVVRWLYAGDL